MLEERTVFIQAPGDYKLRNQQPASESPRYPTRVLHHSGTATTSPLQCPDTVETALFWTSVKV